MCRYLRSGDGYGRRLSIDSCRILIEDGRQQVENDVTIFRIVQFPRHIDVKKFGRIPHGGDG